jgi:hypothetical protein
MLRRKPRRKLLPAEARYGLRAGRILLFAALFLVSGLVAWLVLAGRDSGTENAAAALQRPRTAAQPRLYFHDFVVPQAESDLPEIYLWRRPAPRWDDEQVKRYWIPLEQITLEFLAAENARRIEELFAEVP